MACAAEPALIGIPVPGLGPATDPVTRAVEPPKPDMSAQIEANKSCAFRIYEIIGFDFVLSLANRRYSGGSNYDSSLSKAKHNFRSSWGVDNDPFSTNQFGHPYHGSMYHGFARSAGLDYWESLAYTFGGGVFWDTAGEKTRHQVMIKSPASCCRLRCN